VANARQRRADTRRPHLQAACVLAAGRTQGAAERVCRAGRARGAPCPFPQAGAGPRSALADLAELLQADLLGPQEEQVRDRGRPHLARLLRPRSRAQAPRPPLSKLLRWLL